jgi:hypothetical protein
MQHSYYRNEPSQAEIEWQMAGCPAPYTCDMTSEEWGAEEAKINETTDRAIIALVQRGIVLPVGEVGPIYDELTQIAAVADYSGDDKTYEQAQQAIRHVVDARLRAIPLPSIGYFPPAHKEEG